MIFGRSPGRRLLALGAGAALACGGVTALTAAPAAAKVLLEESFKNASTPSGAWLAPSPKGSHSPCLTAAAAEPPSGSLGRCNAVRDGKAKADPAGSGAF